MAGLKVWLPIVLLQQLQLVSAAAAVCPTFESGAFHAAAARRAMKCSQPETVKAAPQSVGHITLSNLQLVSSSGATCGAEADELKAFVQPGAASMTLGTSTCSLLDVAVIKSDASETATAQMRLDFEKCTGGPSTASVLMNVVAAPDATAATTMMPFWRQVCSVQTTTPAQSLQQLRLYFTETPTGNSSCVGTVLEKVKAASIDKRTCKELCISDVQKYSSSLDTLSHSPDMCTGYSFDTTGAEGCTLYKGDITPSDAGVTGTYCWTLEAQAAQLVQSTPAPPSSAEILEMQATLPKLNVTVSAHSANVLTFVSSDKCFQPFNWITMQNYAAMALSTASVNVKQSEWEEFLALIPSARRLSSSGEDMSATILADRALYGVPPPATPAPGIVVPDCAVPPAEPASMTMTWVLATVLVLAAAGCYYANHGNPAAAMMPARDAGVGKNVAPQDPAAQALVPASAP